MMTTTFFFLMPMIYLSGFVFPIENMPAVIQSVTYLIPLRYFLVISAVDLPEGRRSRNAVAAGRWRSPAWGVAILTLAIARSTKRAS